MIAEHKYDVFNVGVFVDDELELWKCPVSRDARNPGGAILHVKAKVNRDYC